jgi:hypothetical protein
MQGKFTSPYSLDINLSTANVLAITAGCIKEASFTKFTLLLPLML